MRLVLFAKEIFQSEILIIIHFIDQILKRCKVVEKFWKAKFWGILHKPICMQKTDSFVQIMKGKEFKYAHMGLKRCDSIDWALWKWMDHIIVMLGSFCSCTVIGCIPKEPLKLMRFSSESEQSIILWVICVWCSCLYLVYSSRIFYKMDGKIPRFGKASHLYKYFSQ